MIPWRRKWQPIPVCLPGKSHGQRSLVGYSLWGHKESDATEQVTIDWVTYNKYISQVWDRDASLVGLWWGPSSRLCLILSSQSRKKATLFSDRASLAGSDGKESACSAGDLGSIPGSGRSSREGNGNPLQYSCLENPMDRGAWQAAFHGVTKSQIWLNDFTFVFSFKSHLRGLHLHELISCQRPWLLILPYWGLGF